MVQISLCKPKSGYSSSNSRRFLTGTPHCFRISMSSEDTASVGLGEEFSPAEEAPFQGQMPSPFLSSHRFYHGIPPGGQGETSVGLVKPVLPGHRLLPVSHSSSLLSLPYRQPRYCGAMSLRHSSAGVRAYSNTLFYPYPYKGSTISGSAPAFSGKLPHPSSSFKACR